MKAVRLVYFHLAFKANTIKLAKMSCRLSLRLLFAGSMALETYAYVTRIPPLISVPTPVRRCGPLGTHNEEGQAQGNDVGDDHGQPRT